MPYWERPDTFSQAQPYGNALLGYFAFQPAATFDRGYLADWDNDGVPYATGLVTSPGPAGPCAFGWRNLLVQDCSVRMTSAVKSDLPVFGASQIKEAGVCARIQGGTVTSSGSTQYVNQPSLYNFCVRGTLGAPGTVVFVLERWKAGTVTFLQTVGPVSIDNLLDGFKPFTLRLDVWDDGGNVKLVGYVENFTAAGGTVNNNPIAIVGNVVTPFTDSSADKLTGAGRTGFTLGQDEVISSPVLFFRRQGCYAFRVFDYDVATGPGTKRHDEDWQRSDPTAGTFILADGIINGRLLTGDFSTMTAASGTTDDLVPAPSSASAVQWTAVTGFRWALWQAPSASSTTQAPQVDIRWTTKGTATTSRYGVLAKGSGASSMPFNYNTARGYFATLDDNEGEVSLWRLLGNGTAPLKLAAASFSATTSTWYELRLVAKPLDPTILDGPQLLEVYVDGSQETMVLESGLSGAGFSVDGSGGVVDATSARITSGPAEGLVFWNTVPSVADVIELRDWTAASVSIGPAENDQATIDFAGESSGSLPSLDTYVALLASPIQSDQGYETHRTTFESGHTLARSLLLSKRRRWPRLKTVPLTKAQKEALETFWRARSGSVDPFTWTSPEDDQTYTVHFIDGTFEMEELFRNVWEISFGLEELR